MTASRTPETVPTGWARRAARAAVVAALVGALVGTLADAPVGALAGARVGVRAGAQVGAQVGVRAGAPASVGAAEARGEAMPGDARAVVAAAGDGGRDIGRAVPPRGEWRWPVAPVRIVAPFAAPAHAYGPGHRGVDLAADVGAAVVAPAAGVVAFAGRVVDRGILTIDHGDGLVSTLEPLGSVPPVGTVVAAGDPVGRVDRGGHPALGTLHLGIREHGVYVNPLGLFGELPRAVLLPCC